MLSTFFVRRHLGTSAGIILVMSLWCATTSADAVWPAPRATSEGVPQVDPQPRVLEVVLDSAHAGKQHVVFVLPPGSDDKSVRYPAVLTFAGLGESVRGNRAGAWGWVEKYGVVEAMSALHRGALRPADFKGLATDEAVAAYNAALAREPYRGVVLVCPFPPIISRGGRGPDREKLEKFWLDELIPYTEEHLPVLSGADNWGIDGISLGGLLSVYFGFKHADRFAAIAGQQAALGSYPRHIRNLIRQRRDVLAKKRINLATSDKDPFRKTITGFSAEMTKAKLPHRLVILPGRHDKRFVKGPGSLELLLFHDRALRGSKALPSVYE